MPLLFQGKFWVDGNVPMRDRWLQAITDHGGVVTRDQNTADVLIADHVKRAGRPVPEKAVSYTFIEQSVKNGALEDIEAHRITGRVRNPAARSTPAKGQRTAFSRADDQILSNWLAKKEQAGAALKGNKIFQELEALCPHHTWQSWSSRAKNFRGLLPKPTLPAAHEEEEPEPTAPPPRRTQRPQPGPPSRFRTSNGDDSARVRSTRPETPSRDTAVAPEKPEPELPQRRTQRPPPGPPSRFRTSDGAGPTRAKSPKPEKATRDTVPVPEEPEAELPQRKTERPRPGPPSRYRDSVEAGVGRVRFTEEDDQLLLQHVEENATGKHGSGGNEIYKALEQQHPHHSWHSWRDRYLRHLLPRLGADAPSAPDSQRRVVPFTEEDDELLVEYVREATAAKNGVGSSGSTIYQALEEEHPHHTWQSWRNRYLRVLEPRLRAEDEAEKETEEEAKEEAKEDAIADMKPAPPVPSDRLTSGQTPTARRDAIKPAEYVIPTPKSTSKAAHPATSNGGARDGTNGRSTSEKPARNSLLVVELGSRRQTKSPAATTAEKTAAPTSTTTSSGGLSSKDVDSVLEKAREINLRLDKIKAAKVIQRIWKGYRARRAVRQIHQALKENTHNLPVVQANARGVLLRSKLMNFTEHELPKLQAEAREALTRLAPPLYENDVVVGTQDVVPKEEDIAMDLEDTEGIEEQLTPPDEPETPKQEFYAMLNMFLQGTHREIQWPTVQGRVIDLWDLWSTVKSLDRGRSQSARNWEYIAENLGFDWIESPEVTLELKKCYQATLGDFEKYQEAFEAELGGSQGGTGSQAWEEDLDAGMEAVEAELPIADLDAAEGVVEVELTSEDSDAVMEAAAAGLLSEDLGFFRSSPPRIHRQKRPLELDHSSPARTQGQKRPLEPDPLPMVNLAFSLSSVKRRRYSKDMEIPTTPETTPEKKRKAAAVGPDWIEQLSVGRRKAASVAPPTDESDRPGHSSADGLPQLQPPLAAQPRLEPETQDFGFEDGFMSQPDLESQVGLTPTQQLHIEDEHLEPIPFSGFKARQEPDKSPLRTLPNSNSSTRKVIPESSLVRPMNGGGKTIMSSIEDPFQDTTLNAKPSKRQPVVSRSSSPIETKAVRRSLPTSFQRAVSPPAVATSKQPFAPSRFSLPTKVTNKPNVPLGPSQLSTQYIPLGATSNHESNRPLDRTGQSNSRRTTGSPATAPRIIPHGPVPPRSASFTEKIDYYRCLGYRQEHITKAFHATMTWGLAATVMEELKQGRGIPENWRGVWTTKDDDDLKFAMAYTKEEEERRRRGGEHHLDQGQRESAKRANRLIRRLESKHERRMIEDRMAYFENMRAG